MPILESDEWYELVEDEPLQQGVLVPHISLFDPETAYEPPENQARVHDWDFGIVISQDCDLLNHEEDEYAVVCPVHSIKELEDKWGQSRLASRWDASSKGQLISYYPLARCTIQGHERPEALVSFTRVLELRIDRLNALCSEQLPYLRLRPPYKTSLGQRFGYKFSRIALDTPVPTWKQIRATRPAPT